MGMDWLLFVGGWIAAAIPLISLRFVRSRLLALLMLLAVFGLIFAAFYPLLKSKSWGVWFSVGLVILVVGTVLTLKFWNRLTGLKTKLPGEHPSTFPADAKLKIMSWNVFLRTGVSQRLGDNDFKEERVEKIVDAIRPYDVVCLQEACGTANFRIHRLIKMAKRHGFNYAVAPKDPPLFSRSMVDSGLLILSKVPITQTSSRALPIGLGDDAMMHKALQHARLGPGIDLYNTHVQSDYSIFNDAFENCKQKQYTFIADAISRGASGATGARILCGDLNCNASLTPDRCEEMAKDLGFEGSGILHDQPTCHVIYDESGKEVQTVFYKEDAAKSKGSRPDPTSPHPRMVDYILTRGVQVLDKAHVVEMDEDGGVPDLPTMLSDHLPVACTVGRQKKVLMLDSKAVRKRS